MGGKDRSGIFASSFLDFFLIRWIACGLLPGKNAHAQGVFLGAGSVRAGAFYWTAICPQAKEMPLKAQGALVAIIILPVNVAARGGVAIGHGR